MKSKTSGHIIRGAKPFGISSANFFAAVFLFAASLEPEKKERRKGWPSHYKISHRGSNTAPNSALSKTNHSSWPKRK